MGRLFTIMAVVIITGCGNMNPEDFAEHEPRLDLYDYFEGETRAWGLFEDRFGRVRRQFQVDIQGRVDNAELTLEEDFLYDNGEQEHRVWRIRRAGPNRYTAQAQDVIGQALGRAAGNALIWQYEMDLKVGDGKWRVRFDDWMFLQPAGVLINRAKVSKFGIEIGSVTLLFRKEKATSEDAATASR